MGGFLPLEQIKDTKRLRMQLSTVPADELPVLQKLWRNSADYYLMVSADRDLAYVFALYLQKESA